MQSKSSQIDEIEKSLNDLTDALADLTATVKQLYLRQEAIEQLLVQLYLSNTALINVSGNQQAVIANLDKNEKKYFDVYNSYRKDIIEAVKKVFDKKFDAEMEKLKNERA